MIAELITVRFVLTASLTASIASLISVPELILLLKLKMDITKAAALAATPTNIHLKNGDGVAPLTILLSDTVSCDCIFVSSNSKSRGSAPV